MLHILHLLDSDISDFRKCDIFKTELLIHHT